MKMYLATLFFLGFLQLNATSAILESERKVAVKTLLGHSNDVVKLIGYELAPDLSLVVFEKESSLFDAYVFANAMLLTALDEDITPGDKDEFGRELRVGRLSGLLTRSLLQNRPGVQLPLFDGASKIEVKDWLRIIVAQLRALPSNLEELNRTLSRIEDLVRG